MTPVQNDLVKKAFEQLMPLPEPARVAALPAIPDEQVRERVRRLLAAAGLPDEPTTVTAFESAVAMVDRAAEDLPTGTDFAGYVIQQPLGEGGFGCVYKASERGTIRRDVAVKVIKPGFDSKSVMARFDAEQRLMAFMNHEHIARVLKAGIFDRRPYFVMEYVPGVPVTRFADENHLSVEERLRLFQQICAGLQHAHDKGVIHRDIKASNVLGFYSDGKSTAKIIDFGIAKSLTGDRLTDRTFPHTGPMAIGTYESMSPEQAVGAADIDHRTDVYSLGTLLYELLTGVKPFDQGTLRQAAEEEIKRLIREVDPARPSTRLSGMSGIESSKIAAARKARFQGLRRQLRSDLEWIPLMAMGKDRNSRYKSAAALSLDIDCYLAGRPLEATRLARKKTRRTMMLIGLAVVYVGAPIAAWPIVRHVAASRAQEADPPVFVSQLTSEQSAAVRDAEATMSHADTAGRAAAGAAAAAYLAPLVRDLEQADPTVWRSAGRAALMSGDPQLSVVSLEALVRLDNDSPESAAIIRPLRNQADVNKLLAWQKARPAAVAAYIESAKGSFPAMTRLADIYLAGMSGDMPSDRAEAETWLRRAAHGGDPDAQSRLRDRGILWQPLDPSEPARKSP